ncbi:MAG: GtrA family protein [Kribbellaceae bacterium]
MKVVRTLYNQVEHLVHEVAKFGLVGVLGLAVDLPIYNWLVFDNPLVFGESGEGMLHHKPVTAKFISVFAATIATYLGNRHWTWKHRERSGLHREYVLFFVLNGIGLLIAAGCLAFSRYVLDLHSPLADNIAANFIGLGLGTLFRFWSYRKWVFREEIELDEAEHAPGAGVPGVPGGKAALAGTDGDENANESTGEIPAIR